MADEKLDLVMQDLQKHLTNARIDVSDLSTIARNGNEKFVENFLTESLKTNSRGQKDRTTVLQSQFYVSCFWGFRDIVRRFVELNKQADIGLDINAANPGTLWTPLHAATFQEHGPIIMFLLQNEAFVDCQDADGRTAVDFASASDKTWGHFAALGCKRTPKARLVDLGVIQASGGPLSAPFIQSRGSSGASIRMAAYSQPEYTSDVAAAMGGDVLGNDDGSDKVKVTQPTFSVYK